MTGIDSKADRRHVLPNVKKLQFGPESDVFSNALRIVLSHLEEKDVEYREVLCTSGRAFKLVWTEKYWNWERYFNKPDPLGADSEEYLRHDFDTIGDAFWAKGYEHEILYNEGCKNPYWVRDDPGSFVNEQELRQRLLQSIHDKERPVVALLRLTEEWGGPEWGIITGYDDFGDVITGWQGFQDMPEAKGRLQFEQNGYFRVKGWEKTTHAIVIVGDKRGAPPEEEVSKRVLEHALKYSQGSVKGRESIGFEAYDAWARAIGDESVANVDDKILLGKLGYHRNFIGHLAAQKWYASDYLHNMEYKGWNVSDVLHASANYARIHELMWDCWLVFGGYWRDIGEAPAKFRDERARHKATSIIREAKELDLDAVSHLGSALQNLSKTHQYYLSK